MTDPAEAGAQPISPRRKWMAIGVATVLLVVSYSAMLIAFVTSEVDDATGGGGAFALGAALVPFVFLSLAFISGHRRASGAVLKAMGLSLLVAIPVSAIMQDVVTGLVAGFGAGGVVALRAEPVHTWKSRAIAVALVSLYVAVLVRVIIEAGLIAGATLPLVSIGGADSFVEFRSRQNSLQ
jgi:hypothetical protein